MMLAATALQSTLTQRAARAQAGGVDRAGEGFLAAAGLADDQDRQAVARGLGGDRQRGAEIGRGADQLLERQVGRDLLGQRAQLAVRAAAVGVGGERVEQPLGRDRLGEEIAGPGAHRLDRERDRAAVGKHDDRQVGRRRGAARRSARGRSSSVPLGEDRGAHFAAVRPLEQAERAFGAGGADHAPPGARGDRGHVPPLAGVGIHQQQ